MAKQDVNFIDKHIEKVVLGACVVVFLGAAWIAFSGARFAVEERKPADLAKSLDETADQVKSAVQAARYTPAKKESAANPQDDPVAQLGEWFGDGAKGLIKMAGLQERLPRAQAFPAPLISIMKTSPEDRRELVKLVPPGPPIITSGRSTFDFYHDPVDLTGFDPRNGWVGMGKFSATKSWVSVAGQIDLAEQKTNFIAQHYPSNVGLPIVKVLLQRKDLGDLARGWEDVEGFVPYAPLKRPTPVIQPDGRVKIDRIDSYRTTIQQTTTLIVAPPLPNRTGGDKTELPAVPYLDEPALANKPSTPEEASRRIKKWCDLATAALGGKKPFKEIDIPAALILAKAAVATPGAKDKDLDRARKLLASAIEKAPKGLKGEAKARPQAPENLMPIMAHDVSAQPGHTYVYRIRYEILNLSAGNPSELKDPKDAAKVTLFSDWSSESRPIEITSDIYFYLTKADKAKKEVVVTVFKVSKRVTQKQEYRISAGEDIGKKSNKGIKTDFTTGAVCVDIDFDREVGGKKEIALIYADKVDGSLHEKLLSRDLKDKVFRRLSEVKTAQP
jgi:hypothetical protein